MTQHILSSILVILMLVAIVSPLQWYQNSKNVHLDWQNFDQLVSQPGKYKFVKYFTRTCRYCRLLKQVQEQLRSQKHWSFQFYDVDCTEHYDLCKSKVTISGFPYVGIYNAKGQLQSQIGGYYQIQTMRQAFEEIQKINNYASHQYHKKMQEKKVVPKIEQLTSAKKQQAFKDINIPVSMMVQTSKTIQSDKNVQTKPIQNNKEKSQTQQTKSSKQSKKQIQNPTLPKSTQQQGDFTLSQGSIQSGLRLCVLLFGYWMFNKIISPYLKEAQQLDDDYQSSQSNKTRTIQIPLTKSKYEDQNEQAKQLLSEII